MARFDVFRNQDGDGFLVSVQAAIFEHLDTRMVIPLMPVPKVSKPAADLNPVFLIEGVEHSLFTLQMAAVPSRLLKVPAFNLAARRDEIVAAIDLLLSGF